MLEYPKSVYELLHVLASRGGDVPLSLIPCHLQKALDICLDDPPLVQRYVCGTINTPPRVKLRPHGRSILALYEENGEKQVAEAESEAEQSAKPNAAGMTVPEAADKLERLRSQGQPWTSYRNLVTQFGCSSATIHKAIHSSPKLTAWAKRPGAVPRAQSINPVVTDSTPQSREPDPTEEAAIREYIENANPDAKAWFINLTVEKQLEFLEDPDKHQRLLGRKP